MTDARSNSAWWARLVALAIAIALVRLAVLITSGLGLSADEAHYWDWSRHLDWSYPTKGPGIAYAIAGATSVFGDAPWAIRTVAVAGAAIGLVLMGAFVRSCALGRDTAMRTMWWGVLLFALVPAYQVTSLLATIDAPYIACWIASLWAGLAMLRRLESPKNAMTPALALGLALGIGFLFKYTILFLALSLLIALIVRRKHAHCPKRTVGTLLVVLATLIVCIMPVIVWNQREGWPTVAHLLGHLGAPGGDVPTDGEGRAWTIRWFVEFAGSQLGVIGPTIALCYLAVRTKGEDAGTLVRTWCLASATPIVIVYLAVSLFTDAEANWPIAGYTGLIALVALRLPGAMDAWRERVRVWSDLPEPRPRAGFFKKSPETHWQLWTHWSIAYGGVVALATLLLPVLVRTPIGDTGAIDRLQRSERLAAMVIGAIEREGLDAPTLVIMTDRYTSASRLAHALHMEMGDDAPTVTSAASLLGDRRSAYDYWAETDPRGLSAETVLLVGGAKPRKWTDRFAIATIEPMLDAPDPTFGGLYLARGLTGALPTASGEGEE